MKSVLLLRHGKSDWKSEGLTDQERPLSRRGLKAARAVGRFLKLVGQVPDSAVTSSALRARSTLEEAIAAGDWTCTIRVTDGLYEASPVDVLGQIQDEPDEVERLLLVGHEPTWSALARQLLGGGALVVPTACLLRIDFDEPSWKSVTFGDGKLVWMVPARLLTDGDLEV